MRVIATGILTACCALVLAGCSAFTPKLDRETLRTKGIVAGQVVFHNFPTFFGRVRIDGRNYPVRDGMFAAPLSPGEHTITAFETTPIGGSTVSPVRGVSSVTTRSFTKYPINLKFRVTKGVVTSVGTLFLLKDLKQKYSKKFRVILVDNSDEIQGYLRHAKPEVSGHYHTGNFRTASWPFLNRSKLAVLRKALVLHPKVAKSLGSGFVRAPLGTLARLTRDRNKKLRLQMFDTGSTRLGVCSAHRGRAACIQPGWDGRKLLVIQRGRTATHPFPAGSGHTVIALAGKSEIHTVDNRFVIRSSFDNGVTWQTDKRHRLDDSLPAGGRIRIARGTRGLYVNANMETKTLLYKDDGSRGFAKIPAEDAVSGGVNEIDDGIFVGPEWSMFSKSEISYRANRDGRWTTLKLPATECSWLQVVDRRGHIVVGCSVSRYFSEDKGQSWTKITKQRAQELYRLSRARR